MTERSDERIQSLIREFGTCNLDRLASNEILQLDSRVELLVTSDEDNHNLQHTKTRLSSVASDLSTLLCLKAMWYRAR